MEIWIGIESSLKLLGIDFAVLVKDMCIYLCILQSAQALSDAFTAYKYFSPLALHLHNIRTVIVYTCIIAYVTISMFKIGFSQKGWTFSPRVVPDFFQARLFLFWINSDVGGFADDRNTSTLTQ